MSLEIYKLITYDYITLPIFLHVTSLRGVLMSFRGRLKSAK